MVGAPPGYGAQTPLSRMSSEDRDIKHCVNRHNISLLLLERYALAITCLLMVSASLCFFLRVAVHRYGNNQQLKVLSLRLPPFTVNSIDEFTETRLIPLLVSVPGFTFLSDDIRVAYVWQRNSPGPSQCSSPRG